MEGIDHMSTDDNLLSKAREQLENIINYSDSEGDRPHLYYDDFLPEDPNYGEALLAQSFISLFFVKESNFRTAYNYLNRGIQRGLPDKKQKDLLLQLISAISEVNVTSTLAGYDTALGTVESKPKAGRIGDALLKSTFVGGMALAGVDSARRLKLQKVAKQLFEKHQIEYCFDIFSVIWQEKPDAETARSIEAITKSLKEADLLWVELTQPLSKKFDRLLQNVRSRYHPDKETLKTENKGSGCFIATATMQSDNHNYVVVLKEYRDTILTKNQFGRHFINQYYRHSPRFARLIDKSPFLRKICLKFIVKPAYHYAKNCLNKDRINS